MKIVWAHPGIGKTHLFNQGCTSIIDFDSEYKCRINDELGLPNGQDGYKYRNEWRKNNEDLWKQKIRQLFEEALTDAKHSGNMLLASDIMLLREYVDEFDVVITMSKETFIQRAKQRNDYNEFTEGWKNNIDIAIQTINKSKVIITEKYMSDILDDIK